MQTKKCVNVTAVVRHFSQCSRCEFYVWYQTLVMAMYVWYRSYYQLYLPTCHLPTIPVIL